MDKGELQLGKGAFGSGYQAFDKTTGQMVAIKQVGLKGIKESELAEIMVRRRCNGVGVRL